MRSIEDAGWRRTAVVASVAAGAIHLGAAHGHFREWAPAGSFMLVSGIAQLGWALVASRSRARRVLRLGVAGNAATIGLWLASRTAGLPLGPHPWMAEHIHSTDAICTALEVLLVVSCASALRGARPNLAADRLVFALAALAPFAASHDPLHERFVATATLLMAEAFTLVAPYLPVLVSAWREANAQAAILARSRRPYGHDPQPALLAR